MCVFLIRISDETITDYDGFIPNTCRIWRSHEWNVFYRRQIYFWNWENDIFFCCWIGETFNNSTMRTNKSQCVLNVFTILKLYHPNFSFLFCICLFFDRRGGAVEIGIYSNYVFFFRFVLISNKKNVCFFCFGHKECHLMVIQTTRWPYTKQFDLIEFHLFFTLFYLVNRII